MSQDLNHAPSASEYQQIEARARELQCEVTVHIFRASARALRRAFRR